MGSNIPCRSYYTTITNTSTKTTPNCRKQSLMSVSQQGRIGQYPSHWITFHKKCFVLMAYWNTCMLYVYCSKICDQCHLFKDKETLYNISLHLPLASWNGLECCCFTLRIVWLMGLVVDCVAPCFIWRSVALSSTTGTQSSQDVTCHCKQCIYMDV